MCDDERKKIVEKKPKLFDEVQVLTTIVAAIHFRFQPPTTMARPAHETKHISSLQYRFNEHTFDLAQIDDGHSNGTALWLGAQCLSAFLADALKMVGMTRTLLRLNSVS